MTRESHEDVSGSSWPQSLMTEDKIGVFPPRSPMSLKQNDQLNGYEIVSMVIQFLRPYLECNPKLLAHYGF